MQLNIFTQNGWKPCIPPSCTYIQPKIEIWTSFWPSEVIESHCWYRQLILSVMCITGHFRSIKNNRIIRFAGTLLESGQSYSSSESINVGKWLPCSRNVRADVNWMAYDLKGKFKDMLPKYVAYDGVIRCDGVKLEVTGPKNYNNVMQFFDKNRRPFFVLSLIRVSKASFW